MKYLPRASQLATFAILALTMGLGLWKPGQNFDALAYAGCVVKLSGTSPNQLRETTLLLAGEQVSAETLNLWHQGEYRQAVTSHNQVFNEQLSLYRNRKLFLALGWLGTKFGVNPFIALFGLSWLAGSLALLLACWTFLRNRAVTTWIIFAIGILACGIPALMRLTTPDTLAMLAWTLIAWSLLKKPGLLMGLTPALPLFRPDLIILSLLLCCLMLWETRNRIWIVSCLGSVIIFALIQWGTAPWSTTFYVTFIDRLPLPISEPPQLHISQYFSVLLNQTRALEYRNHLLLSLLLGVLAFLLQQKTRNRLLARFAVVSICFLLLHFLIFPSGEARFYAGPNLILLGLIVWGLDEKDPKTGKYPSAAS
ncbi:MAG: hypothetical protein KDC71_06670 [Acidobacteria bacterium]|nr:hypothetical protein [Acidobacteriota bacterium]